MRGISVLIAAIFALGLTFAGPAAPARAAVGYESAYQFESAFLSLGPGESGLFSVFFANTGTTSWVRNTGSQVNLSVCAPDKVTCNVGSPYPNFALGWLSPIAYATHQIDVVLPGAFTAFSYSVTIPRSQPPGIYRFNGDLVLSATGEKLRPEGYYHEVTVGQPAIALDVSPGFTQDVDNEISSTVPGTGQHTLTFNTTLGGTMSFGAIRANDVVQNTDGSYSFCDRNQDRKADNVGNVGVLFTAVNGISVPPSTIIFNQQIPANGQLRVTVDSSTPNEVVRIVGWQDRSNNSGIDLSAEGDTTCNRYQPYDSNRDGLMAVSGRKYYFGRHASFGSQFAGACAPVYLHDPANQVFGAGSTSAGSLRFGYESNDIFRISGTRVSLSQFKAELTGSTSGAGDAVRIAYNPNFEGFSEFDICTNAGTDAPSNVVAATGNFDGGSTADDVRLTFTAPTANPTLTYLVQRASLGTSASSSNCSLGGTAPRTSDSSGTPAGSAFFTVGSATVAAGQQGSFTNIGLANGGYCYRVLVQNPTVGLRSYSNYRAVNLPGTTDATAPRSTAASRTQDGGFSSTLDVLDRLQIDFNESISLSANAIIRVTDSDCGPAANSGPASCSGGTTNSVSDIICGTNAICVLQDASSGTNNRLAISMTGSPVVVSTGSTPGAQFAVVVTDVSGISDLSGNTWNLAGSSDRLIR